MMTATPEQLARLARRLAPAERAPDEAFVARVALARRALALEQEAARNRREQAVVEAGAGAALLLAAHQLAAVGEQAAALLADLSAGLGGIALFGLAAALLVSMVSGEREGLA
jgi:ribulose 1,5-bisphosphate synthetase/thiazole synthase